MPKKNIAINRRRLLGVLAGIGAASAGTGAGTYAFFSDTETSTTTISAGTLELTFDGSGTFEFNTALAPTQTTEESVTLVNDGNIDGSLDIDVSYSESDGDNNDPEEDMSAKDVAENLEVVKLEYGDDITEQIASSESTPTLHDLANNEHGADESTQNDLINLDDPGSEGKDFAIGFRLKDVDDNFQSDGVSITFDFHLNQNDGQ